MTVGRRTFEYLGTGSSPWVKAGLALAAVAAYALAFIPPLRLDHANILQLAATPIVVFAWLFGFWGGTLAAMIAIPLNAFLFSLTSGLSVTEIVRAQDDLLPAVLLLVLGAVLGGLRDVAHQMRRDFAERTEIEEARRESEERYRFVAESASEGIITMDQERNILFANRAAERIFGLSITELVGRPFVTLVPERLREEQGETLRTYLDAVVTSSPDHALQVTAAGRGGREVTLEISFGEYVKEQQHIFTGVIRDVTERAQLEQAWKQAKEDAERANRAKSEFLSRMSHELRMSLNAMLGFAQLLDMDDLEPERRESVDQILRSGRHLLTLLDEVLDIARLESGRLTLSLEPVDVHALIDEAWDLVRHDAGRAGIEFRNGAPPGRDAVVVADRQRLKQVLVNLLSNAVKYNAPGGHVRVACSPGLNRPDRVRVAVSDTGRGISREAMERLFVPFERLGAEHSGIEGTGIGLAVTRGLVDAMEGEIGVESRQGVGSTFWVELPAAGVLRDAPAEAPDAGTAAPAAPTAQRAATVLSIEDDPASFRLIERVLGQREGVTLIPATRGLEGLELARAHRPDLVLLDLHLPDIHGSELLRRIREDPVIAGTPVVIITADVDPEQVEPLLDDNVRAYLPKPLDIQAFLEVFEAIGNQASRPG
jgi:PAS domain S-box-containing protein